MSILQIKLFGGVRITHNNWLTEVKVTREIQALLAYLILQRQKVHSREVLADIFWGEHSREKARGSLNTALWKLKKILEPAGIKAGGYLINTHVGEVGFNRESKYWLDVEVFEGEVTRILTCPFQTIEESYVRDLENALKIYKGELLEAFYEDWALRERERLRAWYLKSLIYLLQYYGFHGANEKAITYGQQVLELEPLREEVHREMMKLYLYNGQRALALRQYENCCSTLAKEFGILPMEDTQALYSQILNGDDERLSAEIFKEQISVGQALRQLREASQTIDLVQKQIQKALDVVARYSEHMD